MKSETMAKIVEVTAKNKHFMCFIVHPVLIGRWDRGIDWKTIEKNFESSSTNKEAAFSRESTIFPGAFIC